MNRAHPVRRPSLARSMLSREYGLGGSYVWAAVKDDQNGELTKALATDLNP